MWPVEKHSRTEEIIHYLRPVVFLLLAILAVIFSLVSFSLSLGAAVLLAVAFGFTFGVCTTAAVLVNGYFRKKSRSQQTFAYQRFAFFMTPALSQLLLAGDEHMDLAMKSDDKDEGVVHLKELNLDALPPLPSWISFSGSEKALWLNKVLDELWPYMRRAAGDLLKTNLNEVLQSYKFGIIAGFHVMSVDLGSHSPRVKGVRLIGSEQTIKEDDEVALDVLISWDPGQSQAIKLNMDTTVAAKVGVVIKGIQLPQGTFRVVLKHFTNTVPGFSAVLLSFAEEPVLHLDIKVMGGNVTKLPGIRNLIEDSVKSALIDSFVWPARVVVPVLPGDYSHLELHTVAYLHVRLIEAKNLPKMDVAGKCDPFVLAFVRKKEGKMKHSKTKFLTYNPTWNEEFFFEVEAPDCQTITLQVMDADTFDKADIVGYGQYKLDALEFDKPLDAWLDLVLDLKYPKEGPKRGQIHAVFTMSEKPFPGQEQGQKGGKGTNKGQGPYFDTKNPQTPRNNADAKNGTNAIHEDDKQHHHWNKSEIIHHPFSYMKNRLFSKKSRSIESHELPDGNHNEGKHA